MTVDQLRLIRLLLQLALELAEKKREKHGAEYGYDTLESTIRGLLAAIEPDGS